VEEVKAEIKQGAGRDLANMFDLELDTEKNQYETGQQAGGSSSEQRQKEIDEALQKLEELARRQQALAQQNAQVQQLLQQQQAQLYQQQQIQGAVYGAHMPIPVRKAGVR